MNRVIRIGSRESDLAVAQSRLVMEAIARFNPRLRLELVTMKALGDLRTETHAGIGTEFPMDPSPEAPGVSGGVKGLFTGRLEEALARGEVDLCVHSLKDMAEQTPDELPVVAMPKRGDPRDCLILPVGEGFRGFGDLRRLCGDRPVGSSSVRRRIQLHSLAPSLRFAPIRGNVPTRIGKLDRGQYGALLLAAAGLERLGISHRAAYAFPVREMIPAPGQGTLAVQGRRGEDYAFLDPIRDRLTEEEARAERGFIRALAAGCASPAAVYARISGGEIRLSALFAADTEAPFFRDAISGPREEGPALAETLARRLLKKAGR
ncbi:MAG: hydroxymethylbilane synthase [Treponema sp.]|nr:hydroxymethylbilane synthase [Treponema sp.]